MPPPSPASPVAVPAPFEPEAIEQERGGAPPSATCSPQMLATVSHELRVPLNGVHGMATLLMSTALTPQQRRYVATIQSSVEALIGLANDVLDWSSLESGNVTFESTSFALRVLVDDVIDVCAEAAHRKQLEIVALFDEAMPECVIGDPLRVRQVLLNLVSNAVKFTNAGMVTLRVGQVSDESGTSLIRFAVSDTGPGIAADTLARLFQPYVSADRILARKLGGTGLGLAICRDLARKMGGEAGVKSRVGVGSTFFCTAKLTADTVTPSTAAVAPDKRLRVLVVAGFGPLLERTQQSLRRCHGDATGVTTIAEADALFAAGQPYDLVVVDQSVLPPIEGSVRTHLANLPLSVPLVRLCRTTDVWLSQQQLQDRGFAAVLTKPVRDEAIHALLHERVSASTNAENETTELRDETEKPRILVVDDDPASVTVAARFVERLGCHVDVVTEGARALEMLQQRRYAAVCLDINLPDVNGCDLTRRWRAMEPDMTRTPFIAMTAHTAAEDRARFLAAGLDDHIAKPLRPDALRAALTRWIPALVTTPQQAR